MIESIDEIENAVRRLSPEQFERFCAWLADFKAELWDREFERDVTAGRLDALSEEAQSDLRDGRCKDV